MHNNVRIILSDTVPLHTLFLAIHTANGGRIKLTNISNIFKQTPAIVNQQFVRFLYLI